jgi:hypothetical protein
MRKPLKVLVIDIGGTNVKLQISGQRVSWKFASGPRLTPATMVAGVKALAKSWEYGVVLGGGNVKKLTRTPKGCREGEDANAFVGGCRLWEADWSWRAAEAGSGTLTRASRPAAGATIV